MLSFERLPIYMFFLVRYRYRLLHQDFVLGIPVENCQRRKLVHLFIVATTISTVSTLYESLQLFFEDGVAVTRSFRER